MRVVAASCVAGVGAALLAACSADAPSASAVATRDSAGVAIVENARPVWEGRDPWSVDTAAPVLQIGTLDGPPELQFDRIGAVRRLGDGRIVAADGGSAQLRIFDPAGRFVRAVGGRGDGPGELRSISGFHVIGGDTIVAWDVQRVVVFAPDGSPVRKLRPDPPPGRSYANMVFVTDDGAPVSADHPLDTRYGRTGVWRDSLTLIRHEVSGTVRDTVARLPLDSVAATGGDAYPVVFGPAGVWAFRGDRLFVGEGGAFEIRVLDGHGRTQRIMRRAWTPVPVTDADRATYRERYLSRTGEGGVTSPQQRAHWQRQMDEARFAAQFPALDALMMDADGNVWARSYDRHAAVRPGQRVRVPAEPATWSVFEPNGRWLGEITFPARFRPRTIRAGDVTGVWLDDDDVEFIRVYRLIKP